MFTTGSKLFLGATVLSIVAAVVVGLSKGGADGWLGVLGMLSAALVFALLFGVNYYAHDGNVSAMTDNATDAITGRPAARRAQHVAGTHGGGGRRHRRRRGLQADRVQGRGRPAALRRGRVDGSWLERAGLG